jgi:endoribonuclease Dicer
MAMNLPSILFKIESTLIALDACNALGLPGIEPSLALESFTKDSDNTEEHDVEQVNFQGGMGNNYERLEFLGDTFLKMATTISIFTLLPDKDEFEYHVERMLLICNKNLFNNALEVKLQEYIRSKSLNRRTWYPEGLTLKKGKKTDPKSVHVLGDKPIADVCEALIGAAYLTAKKQGNLDLAVRAVTTMVGDPKHNVTTWAEYYTQYDPPEWQTAQPSPAQEDMARRIAARLGYTFTHPRLLRCAFMHPSYSSRAWEKLPSYQRLEFLGDALLDMTSVSYLYTRYPGADPQWLTEHKMAMVSNKFLGCLAVSLGFHKNVVSLSPAVLSENASYEADYTCALEKAQADAQAAGLDKKDYARNFWVDCLTPPKCLSDVVESYIGAIFVDSHYDFSVVQTFFDTYVLPFFADMTLYDSFAGNHPVTRISKLIQDRFHCREWRLLVHEMAAATAVNEDDKVGDVLGNEEAYDLVTGARKVVAAVRVHGQTLAHGIASSGRAAKTVAAKKGLGELEGLDVAEFRVRFGCTCRGGGDEGKGKGVDGGEGDGEVAGV